jgi:hypothetical protein
MDSHATTAMQRCHQDWHHGRRRYRRDNRRGRLQLLASGTVLVFAGLLALTGCTTPGEGNDPGTASPPHTTVATTVPATTAPPPTTAAVYKPATDTGPAENVPIPVLPEKAKEFSKEGLIAFAEYWYSTLGYAFETGDPKAMLDISGPNCEACNNMAEMVSPWHSDGRWIVGGQMIVLSSNTSFAQAPDGSYEVTALIRQNHVKFYRADKSLSDDPGQGPSAADKFKASYDAEQWTAISILRVSGG